MRDHETLVGIKAKWDATSSLTGLVTGGLHEGPKLEPRPDAPYATMESTPLEIQPSSCGEIDKRRVKLTVYHRDKDALADMLRTIDGVFTGATADKALTIENATWIQTQKNYRASDKIARAKRTNTEPIWQGTLEWAIWSSR